MKHADALDQLRRQLRQQQALCDDLLAQLAETNLKLRFALSCMRIAKATSTVVLGSDGKPQLELMDGYAAYLAGGREKTIATIEAEITAFEQEMARRAQEPSDTADGDAGAAGEARCEGDGRSAAAEGDAAADSPLEARPGSRRVLH